MAAFGGGHEELIEEYWLDRFDEELPSHFDGARDWISTECGSTINFGPYFTFTAKWSSLNGSPSATELELSVRRSPHPRRHAPVLELSKCPGRVILIRPVKAGRWVFIRGQLADRGTCSASTNQWGVFPYAHWRRTARRREMDGEGGSKERISSFFDR